MMSMRTILILLCTALAAHAQVRISELPQATNTSGVQFVIIQGGATKRIAEGVVRTIPATNVTGLGPFAISTNLAISNVTGLQGALDGKLATNGTLPAMNVTGLGPYAVATNLLSADISDFSNAVTTLSPPVAWTNLTGKPSTFTPTNHAATHGAGGSDVLEATNISGFSNAVVSFAPPTTNASSLIAGTLADGRLSTNVVLRSNGVASASGWLMGATNVPIASTNYGMGWDELGRFTVQTPVGALQMYATGNPSVPTIYWPGTLVCQKFDAIYVNGTVYAKNIVGGASGGAISSDIIAASMVNILSQWQAPNGNGVPYVTRTNDAEVKILEPLAGTYFPVSVATINSDTNQPNLIAGTYLAASNFRSAIGLGPFATADSLIASNISDFNDAVIAVAPQTTNAALLTTGTLDDARLSTNVVLKANLGPFATATNLSSTNIADFSNAVTAIAPTTTNASLLTSGTLADARLSTNVILSSNAALTNSRPVAWVGVPTATNSAGTLGDAALTNNYLYLCTGSNQWRRVLLGTW